MRRSGIVLPMKIEILLSFIGASTLLFLTPGPSMTLILANGAAHGTRAGIVTVLGNAAGFAIVLLIVLAGLHLIAQHFEAWFPIVRYLGAAYLLWLGIRFLQRSLKTSEEKTPTKTSSRNHFFSGIFVAFANPTALSFLAAFLPQFIDPDSEKFLQSSVLALVFISVCVLVQSGIAVAANRAGQWLLSGKGRLIDQIAAVVLIIGGLLLILARG
jgi:threonine/homoserine/homoserine lactone efflux protein